MGTAECVMWGVTQESQGKRSIAALSDAVPSTDVIHKVWLIEHYLICFSDIILLVAEINKAMPKHWDLVYC